MEQTTKKIKRLDFPFTKEKLKGLEAGDSVLISGTIYTARDAAHKRLTELLDQEEKLPFDLKGAIIYYVGPTPEKPGHAIGAAGPTTSYRMDDYAPRFLDLGQSAMIGKGQRSKEVMEAAVRNGAVYFAAIGGAGALIARSIVKSQVIAFDDLGAEAVRELEVIDFPVTVVIDSKGNNLYEMGPAAYLEQKDGNKR
ncbi:Fe-S-containing hydro-lyase [Aminipila sp.]|uniref:Fe-S-containing hydro-lyase n=1 Tax=Aminipila sp. TaxID=2060095 RepID=UPI0028999AA9|nr:Fe-S-containing hydro-lyase [Aminipila sp.]